MSSSVHINQKNKDVLILGEGPTQELHDTTLTAGAKYPINITQGGKITILSLHYNGSNSFLSVNATKIYQFKANNSEIKDYAKIFSVDFNPIYTSDIFDIHRYLIKRNYYNGIIKKNMFYY